MAAFFSTLTGVYSQAGTVCLSPSKNLWGAGLPFTPLQGRLCKPKDEGVPVLSLLPATSLLGPCCLTLVSSSFATCASVLGEPQGACLYEQRCREQVTAEGWCGCGVMGWQSQGAEQSPMSLCSSQSSLLSPGILHSNAKSSWGNPPFTKEFFFLPEQATLAVVENPSYAKLDLSKSWFEVWFALEGEIHC